MQSSIDLLRKSGVRITSSRLFILQAIEQIPNKRPDVYDIYRALIENGSPISMGNVYRVLKEMAAQGLVRRTWDKNSGEPRFIFQLETGEKGAENVQISCGRCGEHVSIDSPDLVKAISQACQGAGITLSSSSINIEVMCSSCALEQRESVQRAVRFGQKATANRGRKVLNSKK